MPRRIVAEVQWSVLWRGRVASVKERSHALDMRSCLQSNHSGDFERRLPSSQSQLGNNFAGPSPRIEENSQTRLRPSPLQNGQERCDPRLNKLFDTFLSFAFSIFAPRSFSIAEIHRRGIVGDRRPPGTGRSFDGLESSRTLSNLAPSRKWLQWPV